MRMDLALARRTHIPSTMMKITIDFDETSSLSIGTYHRQKNGRHAYGFRTYSYDPYTKHNDEDYNIF